MGREQAQERAREWERERRAAAPTVGTASPPVPWPGTGSRPEPAALGSFGNAGIDRHDALFVAAAAAVATARAVRVEPRVLKAMMAIESGGDGAFPPDRCRPCDGYDCVPACGPMQIKLPYHRDACPRCDTATVAGQVELAAHILGREMARRGVDIYRAITGVYFTGPDGTTSPADYLRRVRTLVARMEADAGRATAGAGAPSTPPAGSPQPRPAAPERAPAPAAMPAPIAPADPLAAILGGRPVPAVTYGWLDDVGLDFYGYGVGHGTRRSTQHPGIDLSLPCGTPLFAPTAGVVDCVGERGASRWGQGCGAYADSDGGGVGNVTILLDPGAVKLTLGHCRAAFVSPGQRVAAGQQLATVGSMGGCHVHVETSVRRGDGSYQLVEPVAALRAVMAGATPAAPSAPVVLPPPSGRSAERPDERPLDEPPALEIVTAIAEGAGRNRPRTPLAAGDLWITVHETGNPDPGADALMHRAFVDRGGGPERVSFHFAVDDARAVQILPLDEVAFHAGDGCDSRHDDVGCFRSVAVELCVNAPAESAPWERAKRNLAALLALLATEPGRFVGGAGLAGRFSLDRVAPHHRWSGKECPRRLRAEGSLPAVIAAARALATDVAAGSGAAASGSAPAPVKRFPVALPDDVVLALFPAADPAGPVTKLWMGRGCPPFLRRHDAADGWAWWFFEGLWLRSQDGAVEEATRP